MGIFSSIMDKIFHHPAAAPATAPAEADPQAPSTAAATPEAAAPAAPAEPVDVESVLTQMASDKGDSGNWRTSIVDLLKLLDLDSSLDARKTLARRTQCRRRRGGDGRAERGADQSGVGEPGGQWRQSGGGAGLRHARRLTPSPSSRAKGSAAAA